MAKLESDCISIHNMNESPEGGEIIGRPPGITDRPPCVKVTKEEVIRVLGEDGGR